jgi:hypothetical protein
MKGDVMTSIELLPIREQLDRIEKKLDGNFSNKFLSINQVSRLVSLSSSTIRRAVTKGELKCSRKIGNFYSKNLTLGGGSMDKFISYLWREVSYDNYWRIQTTDPIVKRKLSRRNTAKLVVECFNHPMVIYKLQYYSPQKAKLSFQRLIGQKIKKTVRTACFMLKPIPY